MFWWGFCICRFLAPAETSVKGDKKIRLTKISRTNKCSNDKKKGKGKGRGKEKGKGKGKGQGKSIEKKERTKKKKKKEERRTEKKY